MKSIVLLLLPLAATAAETQLTKTPLFNGKDLSGWTGDGYVVEDGARRAVEV